MDETFRQLLIQARRQEIIRTKGHPKYPRVPVSRYPKLIETRYQAYLSRIALALSKVSVAWARTGYQEALRRYRGDDASLRLDEDAHALVLTLTHPLQDLQTSLELDDPAGTFAGKAMDTAESVNKWVAARFAMEREIALGVVYDPVEPWVQQALNEWTTQNRLLVKSLVGENLSRMETMATDAVMTGKRPEQLTLDILKANKLSFNRARLIARDQIGKLTASLVEKRSLEIGLETYTWQTAMDERVRGNPGGRYPNARPSHWGAQGKIGIYGNSEVWIDPKTGAKVPRGPNDPLVGPSIDVQCRCTASSRWEDLMRPIDQSLLASDPWVRAELGLD